MSKKMSGNKLPWPAALILIFILFFALTGWSLIRAASSPGAAVVQEYRTSGGR